MVKLLYANDQKGAYPQSWYAATAEPLDPFPELCGNTQADVCVIGAGYTGLSAALHLAEAGRDVVLLDAQRVGWGASGRNGGQLGSGQRQDQLDLEKMFGPSQARLLWDLGEEAKALAKSLIDRFEIQCHIRPGIAWAGSSASDVAHLHAYAEHMGTHYDYPLEALDADAIQAVCPSPDFCGGLLDRDAAHLHPLQFALGLARAARNAGIRIHEQSEAIRIETGQKTVVKTACGQVSADHVVLATNGYSQALARRVSARVMPLNNFIVATEPLGNRVRDVLPRDIAVCDSRFVVNYFKLSHDKRLLFGGGESYGYRFPRDIAAKVRRPMLEIFPALEDVRIDYAWGGTLGITMRRLPYLARVAPNILSASGYSGHGLGCATHAGWLMAKAIQGETDGFDAMAAVPAIPFPGGAAFRSPLLVLAMTWYGLRDRLGF